MSGKGRKRGEKRGDVPGVASGRAVGMAASASDASGDSRDAQRRRKDLERAERKRRKEAARAEKQRRKQAEREAERQRKAALHEEKRRRKHAAREERQRREEAERAERKRRKQEMREARRRGEPPPDAPLGLPREAVIAEEMAEAVSAARDSVSEGASAESPAGASPARSRGRGIPASAHARRHSTARAPGTSEVEVRARRGSHGHVDLFDAFEAIHWREFKILLKAEDFSSELATDVADYWRLARRVAGQLELSIRRNREESTPRLREIVFLDTPAFDLYRNSFMLRMRRDVGPGGPASSYELTLKFRDPDVGRALAVDPRPAPGVSGVMKFKEEILLVSSALGGMRSIFSHTCQLKEHREPPPATFAECLALFPMLSVLSIAPDTPIAPAVDVPVEEVLYDLGVIGFRGSKTAKVDMAIWRNAATKKILIGEFAYETHFRHYGRLNPVPKLRSERLYRLLQRETGAWVELGNTKTWVYYGLSGRPVHDE